MLVQVVQEVAQAVLAKRDAPLLGTFPLDGENAVFAVEIRKTQSAQFGDADARVVEHPQDGPVAHGGALGDGARFVGRRAGQQPPLELVGIDGLDQGFADLGEGHAVKGIARDQFAPHQPVEEGTGRTRVGLDGALGSRLAAAAGRCAQVGEPAVEFGRIDLRQYVIAPSCAAQTIPEACAIGKRGSMSTALSSCFIQVASPVVEQ